jgi:hypothetical protein
LVLVALDSDRPSVAEFIGVLKNIWLHAAHFAPLLHNHAAVGKLLGAGIGASHQTGWTGCIARIIEATGFMTKDYILGIPTPGDAPRYQR